MAKIKNFEPLTGVGRFDAEIRHQTMTITTKLHLATSLSAKEQNHFKNRFQPLVKQYWENRYCFDNGRKKIYPVFNIEYVDEMINSHFVLNLLAGEGGSELVARDVYYKVKNVEGFAPTSANLFTGSVEPVNSSGAIITDLRNSFPYYVDMSNGSMTSQTENQLHMLVRQLKRADPNANVEVVAYGSHKTVNKQTVLNKLNQWGLQNTNVRTTKKWGKPKNPFTESREFVKIKIGNGLGVIDVSDKPLFSYPAAAVHEFGHMLGLLDEYSCLSKKASDKMAELHFIKASEQNFFEEFHPKSGMPPAERVANAQTQFIKYCRDAKVDPPHFGQHTISIMSSGSKFLPCHFVTLWAALNSISPRREKWRIVKADR